MPYFVFLPFRVCWDLGLDFDLSLPKCDKFAGYILDAVSILPR